MAVRPVKLRRPHYTIPRHVLDARIVDAAAGAGAELRRHNVREVRLEATASWSTTCSPRGR